MEWKESLIFGSRIYTTLIWELPISILKRNDDIWIFSCIQLDINEIELGKIKFEEAKILAITKFKEIAIDRIEMYNDILREIEDNEKK